MANHLSPIVLNKDIAIEKKMPLQAKINNDIFKIYSVEYSSDTVNKYCASLNEYLTKNNSSTNTYYKCPATGPCATSQNTTTQKNLIIEFLKPTSTIIFDSNTYVFTKIIFNTPAYHVVDPTTIPENTGTETTAENKQSTRIEIEFLCQNKLGQQLIISTLAKCVVGDNSTNENVSIIKSYGIINKYINSDTTRNHLKNGGFKDTSQLFNFSKLFPNKKYYYTYSGSTFTTNSVSNNVKKIKRIVFEEPLVIPEILYMNVCSVNGTTVNSLSAAINIGSCGDRKKTQLIEVIPQEHQVIYSDTNISFIVDKRMQIKKKKIIHKHWLLFFSYFF